MKKKLDYIRIEKEGEKFNVYVDDRLKSKFTTREKAEKYVKDYDNALKNPVKTFDMKAAIERDRKKLIEEQKKKNEEFYKKYSAPETNG